MYLIAPTVVYIYTNRHIYRYLYIIQYVSLTHALLSLVLDFSSFSDFLLFLFAIFLVHVMVPPPFLQHSHIARKATKNSAVLFEYCCP